MTLLYIVILLTLWTVLYLLAYFFLPSLRQLLIPQDDLCQKSPLRLKELIIFLLGILLYFSIFIYAAYQAKPHYLAIARRVLLMFFATDIYNVILTRCLYALLFEHKIITNTSHQKTTHLIAKALLGIPGCLFLAFIIYIV